MLAHRARVKELAETRRQTLHTSLLRAGFTRAVTQVPSVWTTFYSSQMTLTFGLIQLLPQPCNEDTEVWRVKRLSQRPC